MHRRYFLVGSLAVVGGIATASWRLRQSNGMALAHRLELDFKSHLGTDDPATLKPEAAFARLISFAESTKYPHEPGPYGDTLLFEYGCYNWGKGENFEFTLTRQVVFPVGHPADADDKIIQLRMSFLYAPEDFRQLQAMTMWQEKLPPGVRMREFIRASPAYPLVLTRNHRKVELSASPQ